jgi:predicted pyridoxine 5'-phosphate oxidase superfamily flavin-nucleotide-binding protein
MRCADTYHAGEIAVQNLAGAQSAAQRNGRIIRDALDPDAQQFIARQPMLIVGFAAPDGGVWCSLLAGAPGFAIALNERRVRLDLSLAGPHERDPWWDAIHHPPHVGVLAIDLSARARLRINGRIARTDDDACELDVDAAYPNCPQYIQRRRLTHSAAEPSRPGAIDVGGADALTEALRRRIVAADTFFIASTHPQCGADASHRGGAPGFIRFIAPDTLRIPDYRGNGMFNTLGNLQVDPRAGLLFIDYARARTLQLTGRAALRLDVEESPDQPTGGAGRYWDFSIERWIDAPTPRPLRAEYLDAWRNNPQSSAPESTMETA